MHTIEVEIRLACETDAAILARLRYELRASFHKVVEDEAPFRARCKSWIEERLRTESRWKCWIAECQKTLVGNVWAQLVEKIPNPVAEPEHYVYLTNLYVREEYRGGGIGSRLLSAVLDWSKSRNSKVVILWPTERSKPLYSRHGFTFPDDLMEFRSDSIDKCVR